MRAGIAAADPTRPTHERPLDFRQIRYALSVAKDADVTVVLYTNRTVKANHTFKKGDLKVPDIDRIVADVAKILPQK